MNKHGPEIGRCPNCSTPIGRDHPYAWCAQCGNPLPEALRPNARATASGDTGPRVMFRTFHSSFSSWNDLFAKAAEFATQVGRGRLINIVHSADHNEGVVTVWYWSA